jgi:hypothetical protein
MCAVDPVRFVVLPRKQSTLQCNNLQKMRLTYEKPGDINAHWSHYSPVIQVYVN